MKEGRLFALYESEILKTKRYDLAGFLEKMHKIIEIEMENITKTFAARRFFGKTVDRDKTECYDAYKKRNHVGVVGER